jgi:FtsP/CotA-like multicopper oxidase with cupredoxin domain
VNGSTYGHNEPLTVSAGQRLRLRVTNHTMMTHPVHLHGHTFALVDSGLRKDTVLVRPMESTAIDVEADNPGGLDAALPQRLPRRGRHDDRARLRRPLTRARG